MLYVFHVDVGRMMTFDMTVAMSSVENLKDTIQRLHNIPAANIVLLVSGGEMLTQSTQVSYYSAGTDTNPIYMFLTGDPTLPANINSQPETDPEPALREQVRVCLELPPVYDTVVKRAQLALHIHEMARNEERLCERLVHEQHLQQQGWSAVVANIEDLTEEFRQRFKNFCIAFDHDLEKRAQYVELLRNFGNDMTQLERIPILPSLMPQAEEDFHGFDEFLDTDEVFSRSSTQQQSVLMAGEPQTQESGASDNDAGGDTSNNTDSESTYNKAPSKKLRMGNETTEESTAITSSNSQSGSTSSRHRHVNLLQWITSKENHNTLKDMCEECIQGLLTFTPEVYDDLKMKWENIIKVAEQNEVKEIKGLSGRLCKLEEFKYKIKKFVQDQKELSTAFQQNQNRAMNLRDNSILPDLCASHQSQLCVMLQNQAKIWDYRRCIARAKTELGTNLHTRLKRIVFIENAMSEFDNTLLFHRRCLRRSERHIHIIEQIHQAPSIYVAAVTEVVRRKIFSGEFRRWASKLAIDFDVIHSEEIKRRQLFNSNFEGHFLNILFPGMNDMPPAFANENPLVFDARLPNLTRSDIDVLSRYLPDMAPQIQLPDMEPVIKFFVSRSGPHQQERMDELVKQQVAAALSGTVGIVDKQLQHQRIGELQKATIGACDESETDTETDFEKVLTLTQTIATSTSENIPPAPVETMTRSTATEHQAMQSAETITEETEESMRAEVHRLRTQLDAMSKMSLECICLARSNLGCIRTDTQTYGKDLESQLETLKEKCKFIGEQYDLQEEQMARTNSAHIEEVQRLRDTVVERDRDLQTLQQQVEDADAVKTKCTDLESQLLELKNTIQAMQLEKEKAIAVALEELMNKHKSEIESLRCRYKLMTFMERSPSDSSLERIERPTSTSVLEQSTALLEQTQYEAKLAQLRTVYETERATWQAKVTHLESIMPNVSILKEMLEDRDRQLEEMRQKNIILTKENIQLKTRLDALTNDDGNSWLREKIEYLDRDKRRLEEELNLEKSRRLEMESSFKSAIYEPNVLGRGKSSGSSHKYVVLESCGKGDIVFVVWSTRHVQFMVVQDSHSLYFVHCDSLPGLNLRIPVPGESAIAADGMPIPIPYYALGRVIDKEYCQARKDENRYRVSKGSKFYRIKLAPLMSKVQTRSERFESFSTSISRSVSQCDSHSEASTSAASVALSCGLNNTLRQSQSMSTTIGSLTSSAIAASRDVVDSTSAAANVSSSTIGLNIKERTISVTSVAEEDDEPEQLSVERYMSVNEDEEPMTTVPDNTVGTTIADVTDIGSEAMITSTATPTATSLEGTLTPTRSLHQSVITEQPTASNNSQLQLMLRDSIDTIASTSAATAAISISTTMLDSATITTTTTAILATTTPTTTLSTVIHVESQQEQQDDNKSADTQPAVVAAATEPNDSFLKIPSAVDKCATSSSTTTIAAADTSATFVSASDSDEYSSLEAKDDPEFTPWE